MRVTEVTRSVIAFLAPPGRFPGVNRAARSLRGGRAGPGRALGGQGPAPHSGWPGWQSSAPGLAATLTGEGDPVLSLELGAVLPEEESCSFALFFFFFSRERRGMQVLLPTGAGWRQVALLKSSGRGGGEHSPEATCLVTRPGTRIRCVLGLLLSI